MLYKILSRINILNYEPTPKSRVIFQINVNVVKKYIFTHFIRENGKKATFFNS